MRLFQFDDAGQPAIGAAISDAEFVNLSDAEPSLPRDLQTLLSGPGAIDRLRAAALGPARRSLSGVRFLPLIAKPNAIWALALNFKRHLDETGLTLARASARVPAHGRLAGRTQRGAALPAA